MIALIGPGGIGKTRLALALAQQWRGAYADGVFFVALASLADAALLISAIGWSVGCGFEGQGDPYTQPRAYLRQKRMLLVLDNCEHLLAGCAVLADLLEDVPGIKVLVTSRERLNLRVEWVFSVEGLPVVATQACAGGTSNRAHAVELFLQCIQRSGIDSPTTAANLPGIVRICQLLEGMPLGIELAASQVHGHSCAELATEIAQGLAALTTSFRDMPTRHRSLWVVCQHSWQVLNAQEQQVVARLAVFRGGFDPAAAGEVAGATPAILAGLVDKSWLRRNADNRFEMHEFLRQYAGERLQQCGELDATRDRHLAYYLGLAETASPELMSAQQASWMARLDTEMDNLRAALAWSRDAPGRIASGMRIVHALFWFWYLRNLAVEGQIWAKSLVNAPGARLHPHWYARTKLAAGGTALVLGHAQEAYTWLSDSVARLVELGDTYDLGFNLAGLGQALLYQGDVVAAYRTLEKAVAISQVSGHHVAHSMALCLLGEVTLQAGEFAQAQQLFEASLAYNRQLGEELGRPYIICNLGLVAHYQADLAAATRHYERALQLARRLKLKRFLAMALQGLGQVAQEQGHIQPALASYARSLATFQELNHLLGIAGCLERIAAVAAKQGEPAAAVLLLGAAAALRERIHAPIFPLEQPAHAQTIAWLRTQLAPSTYTQLRQEGQGMALDHAVTRAMQTARSIAAVYESYQI